MFVAWLGTGAWLSAGVKSDAVAWPSIGVQSDVPKPLVPTTNLPNTPCRQTCCVVASISNSRLRSSSFSALKRSNSSAVASS